MVGICSALDNVFVAAVTTPGEGESWGPDTMTPAPLTPPRSRGGPVNDPVNDPAGKFDLRSSPRGGVLGLHDADGNGLNFQDITNNLYSHLENANEQQHRDGRFWFPAANDEIYTSSQKRPKELGGPVSMNRAVGMAAALSPQTDWNQNLANLEYLLKNYDPKKPHDWKTAHLHSAALAAFEGANGRPPTDADEDLDQLAALHRDVGAFPRTKASGGGTELDDPGTLADWKDNIKHHKMEKILEDHGRQVKNTKAKEYVPAHASRASGLPTLGRNVQNAINILNAPEDPQAFLDTLSGPKTGNFMGNIVDRTPMDKDGYYDLPVDPRTGMPDWSKIDTGVTNDSHMIRAGTMPHGDYRFTKFLPQGIEPAHPNTYDNFHRATLAVTERWNQKQAEEARRTGKAPKFITPKQAQAIIWLKHKADREQFGRRDERDFRQQVAALMFASEEDFHLSDLPPLWRKNFMSGERSPWEDLLTAWVEDHDRRHNIRRDKESRLMEGRAEDFEYRFHGPGEQFDYSDPEVFDPMDAVGPAVTAHLPHDDDPIGYLSWHDAPEDPDLHNTVSFVSVNPVFRRSEVGTGMWNRAKAINPDLQHSDTRTNAGKRWVRGLERKQHASCQGKSDCDCGCTSSPTIDRLGLGPLGSLLTLEAYNALPNHDWTSHGLDAHSELHRDDDTGYTWLLKHTGHDSLLADADEIATIIQAVSGLPTAPTFRVRHPDDDHPISAQLVFSGAKNVDFGDLADHDLETLLKHGVLDWLTGHDSHPNDFVRLPNGKIVGVDKTRAFQFSDNNGALLESLRGASGSDNLHEFVQRLDQLPDEEYLQLLLPFASQLEDPEGFLETALERKASLAGVVGSSPLTRTSYNETYLDPFASAQNGESAAVNSGLTSLDDEIGPQDSAHLPGDQHSEYHDNVLTARRRW